MSSIARASGHLLSWTVHSVGPGLALSPHPNWQVLCLLLMCGHQASSCQCLVPAHGSLSCFCWVCCCQDPSACLYKIAHRHLHCRRCRGPGKGQYTVTPAERSASAPGRPAPHLSCSWGVHIYLMPAYPHLCHGLSIRSSPFCPPRVALPRVYPPNEGETLGQGHTACVPSQPSGRAPRSPGYWSPHRPSPWVFLT